MDATDIQGADITALVRQAQTLEQVLDALSRPISHAAIPGHLRRRHVVLGMREKLHHREPARGQRKRRLEDDGAGHGAPVAPAGALSVPVPHATARRAGVHGATNRAHQGAKPARRSDRLLALLHRAVAAQDTPARAVPNRAGLEPSVWRIFWWDASILGPHWLIAYDSWACSLVTNRNNSQPIWTALRSA